ILSRVQDAIVANDEKFKIIYWNKIAEKMFGWTEEEVLGKYTGDILQTKIENSSRNIGLEKLLEEGHFEGEVCNKRKDNTYLPVDLNSKVSYNEKGEMTGVLSSVRDISERKHNEKELKETMDRLIRSNKELERFAYVSSHDLQEPLRMVTLFSQLLEKRYKDKLDKDANEFIEYIVEGSQRMKQLIDDLLEYSRVDSQAKEFENVNLENVLDNVLTNLSISIVEYNVTISHDPLPVVNGDKNQLMQVFQNLVINAIKFHGQNTPEINIHVQKKENEWIFAVEDNGIGIDVKHQKQIFEVFKRLQHNRDEYPGSGIGLSITQKIIIHHGGRIWVESELGKGSTFYFTIPTK
ncbi:sensor histidine kinase, partial [Methanobacterium sp.]|uniref:sensor histidine kinase n=1 Tax=Methanobacterium sp. TaxID=2164 RepID=UPI003C717AD8